MQLEKHHLSHLKKLAHSQKPVVMIGQKGLTENVVEELRRALKCHELVKIKISAADKTTRGEIISKLCHETGANCINKIGNTAVLFLRNHRKPVIVFPPV